MNKKQITLKAFTLTELLVVLGIIGILTLVALPMFDSLGSKAYATEAETNLKHIKNLQEASKIRNFEYSAELAKISFQAPELKKNGGTAVFEYEITEASKTTFLAKAKAVEDFDGDGVLMEITINEKGKIETTIED